MPSSPPPGNPTPAATRRGAARPIRALLALLAVAVGVLAGTYWYPWSYRAELQLSFQPTSAATTPAQLSRYVQEQREVLEGLVASRWEAPETQRLEHVQVTMLSPEVICLRVDRRDRWTPLAAPAVQLRKNACSYADQSAQGLLFAYQMQWNRQAQLAPEVARPTMPASKPAIVPATVAIAPAPADAQAAARELAALRVRRAELTHRRDQLDAQIDGDNSRHLSAGRALADENPRVVQIVAAIEALEDRLDYPVTVGVSRERAMGELADRYVELKAELVRMVARWDHQARALAGPMELLEAAACASQAAQAASEPAEASPAAASAADPRPIQPQFEMVVSGRRISPNWLHPHRPVLALYVAAAGGGGLLAGLAFLLPRRRGKP